MFWEKITLLFIMTNNLNQHQFQYHEIKELIDIQNIKGKKIYKVYIGKNKQDLFIHEGCFWFELKPKTPIAVKGALISGLRNFMVIMCCSFKGKN